MTTNMESTRLSRSYTAQQLERATNPTHRQMLERTLVVLDARMVEFQAQEEAKARAARAARNFS
jgi:hypothetical protein